MAIELHRGNLPDGLNLGNIVAVDTETMGLKPLSDRLCVVQLSSGNGVSHLIQFAPGEYEALNLKRILSDPDVLKLFHYARFDIAIIRQYLGVTCKPVYCTKIASKLARTYTDRHGLKDLCRELLGIDLSKQQQSSDWGCADLSEAQLNYAAADVLHLHSLREKLDIMLAREGRSQIAQATFDFLITRAELDLMGWDEIDIFAHS